MKLSAVIQLIDSYQQYPAVVKSLWFALDDKEVKPQVKPQAQYVLTNLAEGQYRLAVVAEPFFPVQFDLDVKDHQPLVQQIYIKMLSPNPTYPYPEGTTVLRGLVTQENGQTALSGVMVTLEYVGYRGKQQSKQTFTYNKGRYDGRYAIAVTGKLQDSFQLTVSYRKPGFQSITKQVLMERGFTRFLDAHLNQLSE